MKLNEITSQNSSGYTQYVLTDESRNKLKEKFPPKYSTFVGDHITYQFGVKSGTAAPPEPKKVKVIGHVDSGDGIEALIVSIDGETQRPDGNTFHITWSLDKPKYSASDSNVLIKNKKFTIIRAMPITVEPKGT